MSTSNLALLLVAALGLSACGINRAVGVLPNTLDDLQAERTRALADGSETLREAPLPPTPGR